MKRHTALTAAAAALCLMSTVAEASEFRSPTRMWVKIEAHPGETRWGACKRVFRYGVYRARKGPDNVMLCYVDYDRAYGFATWRFYRQ